jgi:hypothetical protein
MTPYSQVRTHASTREALVKTQHYDGGLLSHIKLTVCTQEPGVPVRSVCLRVSI